LTTRTARARTSKISTATTTRTVAKVFMTRQRRTSQDDSSRLGRVVRTATLEDAPRTPPDRTDASGSCRQSGRW
jgi:hypothetical protein